MSFCLIHQKDRDIVLCHQLVNGQLQPQEENLKKLQTMIYPHMILTTGDLMS